MFYKLSSFKGFLHRAHTICLEKYIKEETQFLIDIFIDNGCKRKFPENLVKDYNAKKKTNVSRNYTNWKKILSVPNIEPKIRREFKKVKKTLLSYLERSSMKHSMSKQTKATS